MNDLFVRKNVRGVGIGRALINRAQRLHDSIPGALRSTWLAYEIDAEVSSPSVRSEEGAGPA